MRLRDLYVRGKYRDVILQQRARVSSSSYALANDLEQAQGRVLAAIRRIVEASPLLRREAKIALNNITFPATGATITAISSDYAGAAGANPTISCFDELWGYTSERSARLWDEMIPVPTRKISCRLTEASPRCAPRSR